MLLVIPLSLPVIQSEAMDLLTFANLSGHEETLLNLTRPILQKVSHFVRDDSRGMRVGQVTGGRMWKGSALVIPLSLPVIQSEAMDLTGLCERIRA